MYDDIIILNTIVITIKVIKKLKMHRRKKTNAITRKVSRIPIQGWA